MPRICGVQTAVPPHKVDQSSVELFVRNHFGRHFGDTERLMPVFRNSGISTRYFSQPVEWFSQSHDLSEKNSAYIAAATALGEEASLALLDRLNLKPHEIDYIIYVNTTGLATPSIDARLINRLKLRNSIRRTPIWGLGCAGGVAGLSHAYHHALGHPKERILVVAAELCGLTFMADDFSKSNLVAAALFGEGAAAVLVCGDDVKGDGLEIIASRSRFFPDSLDVMGWNIVSHGLQVVFAQRIPDIVAAHAAEDFREFLSEQGLTFDDIAAYLLHPGGMKVIEAYRQALALSDGELALASETLRDFGNMSSVTVLFVLEKFLRTHHLKAGSPAIISALGPGFCSESMLVRV
jgi:alkylresorcinol/alkylpyrone synthase